MKTPKLPHLYTKLLGYKPAIPKKKEGNIGDVARKFRLTENDIKKAIQEIKRMRGLNGSRRSR